MKKFSIGKLPNNDIVYNAPVVSRMHADILVADDGTITLTDHSKNGTTVNGTLLQNASRIIHRGDNVMFANSVPLDWSRIIGGGGSDGKAPYSTAALVLGILSLVTPFVGFILGIIGWCLAQAGLNRTKHNRDSYKGIGKLKAGLICSIVSVGLNVIGFIIGIFIGLLAY